jgi:heat shock protein HslJ
MSLVAMVLSAAKRAARCAAAVAAVVVLASCEDGVTHPSDLGGEWRLASLRLAGGAEISPPATGQFTLRLEADGQAFVRADCNGCGGRYVLGGGTVTLSQMACTLIACPNAPFDTQYLGLLDGTTSFDLQGDVLTITSSRGTLRFRR